MSFDKFAKSIAGSLLRIQNDRFTLSAPCAPRAPPARALRGDRSRTHTSLFRTSFGCCSCLLLRLGDDHDERGFHKRKEQ